VKRHRLTLMFSTVIVAGLACGTLGRLVVAVAG
jgi:hypothetical protein